MASKITMASPLYTGFRVFLPISEVVHIPLDQFNYVVSQLTCVLLGLCLRVSLPPSKVPARWRSLFCLLTGLATVFFMIGWAIWQVLLQLTVSYAIMKVFSAHRHMGLAVFVYAMGHLLVTYVLGLYKPLEHMCYDPTYTLMITTQKATSLAFSLVDWSLMHGAAYKGFNVPEERKKWAVKSLPGLLDYLAFMLTFQSVLAGPFCHYNTFLVFLHGKDPRKQGDVVVPLQYIDHPPSLPRVMITKILAVALWLPITVLLKPRFPDSRNVDPDFIATTCMPVRVAYLYVSLFMDRTKYYITWTLSDVVCNASGLGYSGLDGKGRHTWVGMSNVRVWNIETATSLKKYLDNWNISTTTWLRHVCYQRAPVLGMYLTFLLSSLWHGLYSGYYVTFLSATVCVAVGRKIRATVRPLFQSSQWLRVLYEVVTFLGTQVTLAFLVLSFVVLDWSAIVRFHNSFYWVLHVGSISLFLIIPTKESIRSTATSKDGKISLDKTSNINNTVSKAINNEKATTAVSSPAQQGLPANDNNHSANVNDGKTFDNRKMNAQEDKVTFSSKSSWSSSAAAPTTTVNGSSVTHRMKS